ncbi:hypothetical protein [Anaerotignum sp.]|uniref:hypothetical protein n=1 Tax=Anaerotignum sp. TaxID=2039241 RepID=UPI00271553EC|nr:hypothetical protein [Anaerotignum sp.]
MHYNSCRLSEAQKAVLKYIPKHNHILTEKEIPLLKNQINTIIYLVLKNNEAYWFFVKECTENQLIGFSKQHHTWVHTVIQLSNINTFG